MQALLQLPAPSNSLHSLRHYYDKMEIYIRGLESVGQYQETYGSLLVPVVLDKMPAEVRRHLSRERGDSNWPLNELRRAINREIQMMKAGSAVPQLEVDAYGTAGSLYTGAISRHNRPISTTTEPDFNNRKTTPHCETHFAIDCHKFPDVDSRMENMATVDLTNIRETPP